MISLQRSMHSSQMYTPGPAMSFLTCFWLFPQKEHLSRSPPSPMRATRSPPGTRNRPGGPDGCYDGTAFTAVANPSFVRRGPGSACRASRATNRIPFGDGRSPDRPSRDASGGADGRQLAALDDLVDQAVVDRLGRGEDLVALDVGPNLVLGASRVARQQRLEQRAHPQDLPRLD